MVYCTYRQLVKGGETMNPKQFLQVGGVVLLLLGIVGYLLPGGRIIGDVWYLTPGENLAHTVLGIAAIAAAFVLPAMYQKWLVIVVGVLALYFSAAGFLVRAVPPLNYYGLANLENPYDNLLHLVVGAWALWAAMGKKMMKA